MNDVTLFLLASHQIRYQAHVKVAVSLVIADGHFNFPQGFVWVCMGNHVHFITHKGNNIGHAQCCLPLKRNSLSLAFPSVVFMSWPELVFF